MTEPGGAGVRRRPGAAQIILRVLLSVVGAYALAASFANLASPLLMTAGMARIDAVAWATLAGFPLFMVAGFTAFAVRSLLWLVVGFAGLTGLMMLSLYLMGGA